MSGDVEKWVQEGALALIRVDNEPDCGMNDVSTQVSAQAWEDARIAIRAFLAAAERDGVVLVRVPDAMDWRRTDGPAQGMKTKGWNDSISAVLAGKVTV